MREEAKVLDLADQKMSDTEQTKFGDENLLEVKDLKTYFYTEDGVEVSL